MPSLPPVSSQPTPHTALDIVTDAMIEVGMISPGEVPDGDAGQWAFRKLNYVLDYWAARKQYVYSTNFQVFQLVANLNPHTIGPGDGTTAATFDVPVRPVRIESAALILNTSPNGVDVPMNLRDEQWWALQRVKTLKSSIPTDLFYSADWPNGSLNFWPIPNTAYQVRLEIWNQIQQFNSITDPLGGPTAAASLPPAYRAALMLTLAESLQPGASKEANPMLSSMALAARIAVFGNNAKSPRISTQDYGMPRAGSKPTFNYETGNLT